MTVKFSTFKDVDEFCKAVSAFQNDVDVYSGRYVVDAKSLLGLYSLDLSKELEVKVHGISENDTSTEKVEAAIEKWAVK